jgi:hypothetical protein
MKIAVFANGRVAKAAVSGIGAAFQVAFKAGTVMGFALVSLGVLMLFITIMLFRLGYDQYLNDTDTCQRLYEAVSGTLVWYIFENVEIKGRERERERERERDAGVCSNDMGMRSGSTAALVSGSDY